MKFSSVLFAALAASVNAQDAATKMEEKIAYWTDPANAENSVISRDYFLNEETGTFEMPENVGGGLSVNVPRVDEDRRRLREWRSQNQDRRKLQNLYPDDGAMVSEDPVPFVVPGIEGWSNVELRIYKGSPDAEPVVVSSGIIDIVGDVLEASIGGFYQDTTVYWEVVGSGEGESTGMKSFTYGPGEIMRASGTTMSGTDNMAEASYPGGGDVQNAVGRIYFSSKDPVTGKVQDFACSGTAVYDNKTGRSTVLTAAHCIWDDVWETWAFNAIFIPNRDAVQTTLTEEQKKTYLHRPSDATKVGATTTDICGWWSLSGGVVHNKWKDVRWPLRIEYDYGFYIIEDKATSHSGQQCGGSDVLDIAVTELNLKVDAPVGGEHITGFGYSLSKNPDFRYCAETAVTRDPVVGLTTWWLDTCGLSQGSSGGPWLSGFNPETGRGTVVGVNAWSYSARTGMGGPIFDPSEARCLMNYARETDIDAIRDKPNGEEGLFATCYDRDCVRDETSARRLRGGRELCAPNQ